MNLTKKIRLLKGLFGDSEARCSNLETSHSSISFEPLTSDSDTLTSNTLASNGSIFEAIEPFEETIRRDDSVERAENVEGVIVSDEALLRAYRDSQDGDAFGELVQRYEAELFHYLRNYLGNATLAEDVFQSTFLAVHARCGTFEEGRRFRPWLYAVATHQAIDALRRMRRHQNTSLDSTIGESADNRSGEDSLSFYNLLDDEGMDPATSFWMQEDAQLVQQAVQTLPELLRQVVLLVYFQGLKYREAAESLGVPVGTVKSRLHAAIAKLSETLTELNVTESVQ